MSQVWLPDHSNPLWLFQAASTVFLLLLLTAHGVRQGSTIQSVHVQAVLFLNCVESKL